MNKIMNLEEDTNQNMFRLIKGIAFAFIITLIALAIFSIILAYTKTPESIIPIVIMTITVISIFIGSFLSVSNIKKSGLLNGGIVGLAYIVLLYLTSSITSVGFSLNLNSIIMMIAAILAGMIGGIVGVNMKK